MIRTIAFRGTGVPFLVFAIDVSSTIKLADE
jgi:hypothetical protein